MITIKNAKTLDNQISDFTIPSEQESVIDAKSQLLIFPGVIDTHIYLDSINRENWHQDLLFAIKAGVTTILESPEKNTSLNSKKAIEDKRKTIDTYLADLHLPMQHHYFFRATADNLTEIGLSKPLIKGIYLCSKLQKIDWERIFQIASWEDLPIIFNLREDGLLSASSDEEIDKTLRLALTLAEKQSTRLFILNVCTKAELELIQKAKENILLIYAETSPEILLSLPDASHLWGAINNDLIECIGSGYKSQKMSKTSQQENLNNPSYLLPTLLNAYHQGKVTLDKIVQLTNYHPREIFEIKQSQDVVLIDPQREFSVKVKINKSLEECFFKGYPVHTILQGRVFSH